MAGCLRWCVVAPFDASLCLCALPALPAPDAPVQSSHGSATNTQKLRLYASAALPYGKPTYFEAAVEAISGSVKVCAPAGLCGTFVYCLDR